MIGSYKMSIIGSSHLKKENGVCQDSSDVKMLENGWVVAVIADGLGSAKKSEVGSSLATKTIIDFVSQYIPNQWDNDSLQALLKVAYHTALKAMQQVAEEEGSPLYDYDTTLTTAIYNGNDVVYAHVGDGGIITITPYGDIKLLTEVQKGEAYNETYPLRSGPDKWILGHSKEQICAFTMMTDGIFDIACPWLLATKDQRIYINYVRPFLDRNVLPVNTDEDFFNAEVEIRAFFEGKHSVGITDDKTIVGVINTEVLPEEKEASYYEEPDWENLSAEKSKQLRSHVITNSSAAVEFKNEISEDDSVEGASDFSNIISEDKKADAEDTIDKQAIFPDFYKCPVKKSKSIHGQSNVFTDVKEVIDLIEDGLKKIFKIDKK